MKNVFGITGWKNSGKTTLVARLVENLTAQGFSVSTIKHAHHAADIDQEGTDSYKHRLAGAREVMLATPRRFALMHELPPGKDEPPLEELLARMGPADIILVEGYKRCAIPKIRVTREGKTNGSSIEDIPNIVAYASDRPDSLADAGVPVFNVDDPETIAAFIVSHLGLSVKR